MLRLDQIRNMLRNEVINGIPDVDCANAKLSNDLRDIEDKNSFQNQSLSKALNPSIISTPIKAATR
jgi:hypothetical protein